MKKQRKSKYFIIKVFLVCFFFVFLAFGMIVWKIFKATIQLTNNGETTIDKAKSKWESKKFDSKSFFKKYPEEKFVIESTHGKHQIPISWFYQENSKNRKLPTVIAVHGLWGNRYAILPVVEKFLEKGFNVVIYDQRSSGENYAPYTTFGYLEKYDLMDVLAFIKPYLGEEKIGLWGESFGGGTVGLAVSEPTVDETVDFVILDCPVNGVRWYVEKELKNRHVPNQIIPYLIRGSEWINERMLAFNYHEMDVSKKIKNVQTPILIIRTLADKMTPEFMGKEIYEGILGDNKILWTVKNSRHVEVFDDYPEEYWQRIEQIIHWENQPTVSTRIYTM